MKPIPVSAAKQIAEEYGYDQIIIVARKVGENGGEHCTTFGRNKDHCDVAAQCGDFLKHEVMGWHKERIHESTDATEQGPMERSTQYDQNKARADVLDRIPVAEQQLPDLSALPKSYGFIIEEFGPEITWEILGQEGPRWYVWASHNGVDGSFKFKGAGDTLNDAMMSVSEELWSLGPEWVRTQNAPVVEKPGRQMSEIEQTSPRAGKRWP